MSQSKENSGLKQIYLQPSYQKLPNRLYELFDQDIIIGHQLPRQKMRADYSDNVDQTEVQSSEDKTQCSLMKITMLQTQS